MNVASLAVLLALAAQAPQTQSASGPQDGPRGPLPGPEIEGVEGAELVLVDGNYVGVRFAALGKAAVQKFDNMSLLCVSGMERAQKRLDVAGGPATDPEGRSQLIDAAQADRVADALARLLNVRRAQIEELDLRLGYHAKRKRAKVTGLCDDGLFAKMGLKDGDVILRMGDRVIAGRESAAVALKYFDEAPAQTLTVWRNGEERTLDVKEHARAMRAMLLIMSRTLAMVPDPANPSTIGVERSAP